MSTITFQIRRDAARGQIIRLIVERAVRDSLTRQEAANDEPYRAEPSPESDACVPVCEVQHRQAKGKLDR